MLAGFIHTTNLAGRSHIPWVDKILKEKPTCCRDSNTRKPLEPHHDNIGIQPVQPGPRSVGLAHCLVARKRSNSNSKPPDESCQEHVGKFRRRLEVPWRHQVTAEFWGVQTAVYLAHRYKIFFCRFGKQRLCYVWVLDPHLEFESADRDSTSLWWFSDSELVNQSSIR